VSGGLPVVPGYGSTWTTYFVVYLDPFPQCGQVWPLAPPYKSNPAGVITADEDRHYGRGTSGGPPRTTRPEPVTRACTGSPEIVTSNDPVVAWAAAPTALPSSPGATL
jgi:hypothetical protein